MPPTHDTFAGVYPAMTTPFTESNAIDHDQLAADARRLEAAGVSGVVPVGSTGESATLTHDEHIAVVETVVEAVDIPVIAGTGSNATREALSLSRRAAAAGADGLLLISPYYNRPEPRGVRDHYEHIADTVDLPCIIYNVPSRTGLDIRVDTVVELARHPNIAGYKAASGDLAKITEVVERTRDCQFDVLSGDDALTLPIMAIGGTGTISVVANVEPRRAVRLVDAALEGRTGEARRLHHELGPLVRALFAETNPIPVKTAMSLRDYGPETLRPPLTCASESTRTRLADLLADLEDSEAVA